MGLPSGLRLSASHSLPPESAQRPHMEVGGKPHVGHFFDLSVNVLKGRRKRKKPSDLHRHFVGAARHSHLKILLLLCASRLPLTQPREKVSLFQSLCEQQAPWKGPK